MNFSDYFRLYSQVQMQCWHESFANLKETGSVIAGVHIEESQVKEKV